MTFDECLAEGRKMDERQVETAIRLMATEPERFAALLVMVERMKHGFVSAVCAQDMAVHHGALAHGNGTVYGLERVEKRLREIIEGRPQAPRENPPPEED